MKTFPTHNHNYVENDRNKNASINEIECQRDACEEELYRLRHGIEQLLANTNYRDQQSNRNLPIQDQLKSIGSRLNDPNDRNHDSNSRQTLEHSPKSQVFSESYISTPSSRQNLRTPADSLNRPITSNNINLTDIFASADLNDPHLKPLILKILEAKALDCICTGYSKKNTQKEISNALQELNHRLKSTNSSRSISASRSPLSSSRSRTSSASSSRSRHKSKKKSHSPRKDTLAVPKAKAKSRSKGKTKQSKKSKKKSSKTKKHKKHRKPKKSGCFGC